MAKVALTKCFTAEEIIFKHLLKTNFSVKKKAVVIDGLRMRAWISVFPLTLRTDVSSP